MLSLRKQRNKKWWYNHPSKGWYVSLSRKALLVCHAAKARNLQKKIDQEGPQELSKEDWITSDPSLVELVRQRLCPLSDREMESING